MTDFANVVLAGTSRAKVSAEPMPYRVEETYWGYTIHKTGPVALSTVALQAASMILGASFLAAGLGLLILPPMMLGSADFFVRTGAIVIFFMLAAYLLWFASRGMQSEVQIDKSLGEVREVVRNRGGRSTLIGRYGFDTIGGVFLDRAHAVQRDRATLVLRYRNTSQTLSVVEGKIATLEGLCTRVGKDLMMEVKPRRPERTIVPRSR